VRLPELRHAKNLLTALLFPGVSQSERSPNLRDRQRLGGGPVSDPHALRTAVDAVLRKR